MTHLAPVNSGLPREDCMAWGYVRLEMSEPPLINIMILFEDIVADMCSLDS